MMSIAQICSDGNASERNYLVINLEFLRHIETLENTAFLRVFSYAPVAWGWLPVLIFANLAETWLPMYRNIPPNRWYHWVCRAFHSAETWQKPCFLPCDSRYLYSVVLLILHTIGELALVMNHLCRAHDAVRVAQIAQRVRARTGCSAVFPVWHGQGRTVRASAARTCGGCRVSWVSCGLGLCHHTQCRSPSATASPKVLPVCIGNGPLPPNTNIVCHFPYYSKYYFPFFFAYRCFLGGVDV